jgi:hypothetical protein
MRKKFLYTALLFLVASTVNFSCKKETKEPPVLTEDESVEAARGNHHGHLKLTKTFSSDLVVQWLNMQLDMLRVPLEPGAGTQAPERSQAYCGIALYEAVVPGMPNYQSLQGQLTGFPSMPSVQQGKAYHWPACANAALAEMNRKLFPAASASNKTKLDNLESSLQSQFATETDDATLQRSIAFGKEVAAKIFAWASADGSANVNPPYVPLVGPGLWIPTVPPPALPANPYAYQRRLLVPGVATGTELTPPPPYSTDPNSAFYAMVKDVYDKSFTSTNDQKAMAIYHRDAPGYPGGGHFVAILSQVINKAQPSLEIAALAYAKVGLGQYDATMICFTDKYNFNLVRPVTYIKSIIDPAWNPLIPTPNHPEFPSGHATINSSVMKMLADVFGVDFQITLHTYDYLNLPPRSYNSFEEMSKEMSDSRVFGGIHYQATCDKSRVQGRKVAQNILKKVDFKKGNNGHGNNGHHHHGRH